MTTANLYEFIARHRLGVLATIADSGQPQSALVGIAVTRDLEIVFDTVKSTRKYPNLMARPRCSFVIGWDAEQTVQFEGHATELKGSELGKYKKIYFRSWPDGTNREAWPGIVYFVVRPNWIRYSDFAQDPPEIQEFVL